MVLDLDEDDYGATTGYDTSHPRYPQLLDPYHKLESFRRSRSDIWDWIAWMMGRLLTTHHCMGHWHSDIKTAADIQDSVSWHIDCDNDGMVQVLVDVETMVLVSLS